MAHDMMGMGGMGGMMPEMANMDLTMMLNGGNAEGQGESSMQTPMLPSQRPPKTERKMGGVSSSGLEEMIRAGWDIEHPLTGGASQGGMGMEAMGMEKEQGPSLAQQLSSAGAPGPEQRNAYNPGTPSTSDLGTALSGRRDGFGLYG